MVGPEARAAGIRRRQADVPPHGTRLVGADDARATAVPSRLTLWLAGLAITHRLIPAGRPQHNGAVERFHGGVEHRWQGENDGLAALPWLNADWLWEPVDLPDHHAHDPDHATSS